MNLKHPNVLKLFGACSVNRDPPWFFVCPYYKNKSLVEYLRQRSSDSDDLLKMVEEIAKGMEYLHANNVLHGGLRVRRSHSI